MKRRLFRGRALALVAVTLLLGAEAAARFGLGLGDPPLSVADPTIEYMFKPGTYHRFGNTMVINAWHMRSEEFPARKKDESEFRVLVFGDSVVNGGALTDQSELATEMLRDLLAHQMARPVVVGNISAGSWGPSNMMAYAKKFGFFEADVVVIVLNSMDIGDNPTGQPVVGVNPAFPSRRPAIALEELVCRYLWPSMDRCIARAIPGNKKEHQPVADAEAEARRSIEDLSELVKLASDSGAMVLLAHFPTRDELADGLRAEHGLICKAADELAVPLIEMQDAMVRSVEAGKDPYRPNDSIHVNALGQRIITDVLREAIVKHARSD